jgi:hypothetical protein
MLLVGWSLDLWDPLIRHGRPEAVSWFLAPFGEL